jgi:hypothetical protein
MINIARPHFKSLAELFSIITSRSSKNKGALRSPHSPIILLALEYELQHHCVLATQALLLDYLDEVCGSGLGVEKGRAHKCK